MARSKGDRFWRKFFTSKRFLGFLSTLASLSWTLQYLLYHYVNETVSNFTKGVWIVTVVSVPLFLYTHLFAFGKWRSAELTGSFSTASSAGGYLLTLLVYWSSASATIASVLLELVRRAHDPAASLILPIAVVFGLMVWATFEYQRACGRLLREPYESEMPSHAVRSITITAITTGVVWTLVAYVRCRVMFLSASFVTFLAFLSARLLMCAFDLREFQAETEANARLKANDAFRDVGVRLYDSVAGVKQSLRMFGTLWTVTTRSRRVPYANLAVGLVAIYVSLVLMPVVWEIKCYTCLYEWLLSEYETFRECGDKHVLWEKVLQHCAPADDREPTGVFAYALSTFGWMRNGVNALV